MDTTPTTDWAKGTYPASGGPVAPQQQVTMSGVIMGPIPCDRCGDPIPHHEAFDAHRVARHL